ncbi:helix-turn-helix domain-containing protein [Micromonospora sp. NPDC000207]|uniref:helix-turn-helix domain-containing protein n=1 Tax=Micromonospora sp. NPDC000207 TaxID=3154246 RepID=UPI00331E018D
MDELPIGRRVAYWRSRRKLSQQVFADRLGKSKSWVDKVERGVRRLDKFSVLHDIADILQIDVSLLLGRDPERRTDALNGIDQVEVEEIRAALEQYDKMTAYFAPAAHSPPLPDLEKAVRHAWLTYQYGRYAMLTRALPKLLRDTQAADAGFTGDQGRVAANLLSQVYQIASSVLRKIGECDLAWLAADRATVVAQRADDQLLAGIATTRVGIALVAMGRPRPALELNVNIANLLAPGYHDSTPQGLSVYGQLLLQGAMAAARLPDPSAVDDLLDGAEDAANQLGGDHNHYWTSFGPTNIELHRAAAYVELGEGGRAVEIHQRLPEPAFNALLPERRAHHLLDLARAYAQIGDVGNAGEMLLRGDRLSPSEIRCRPIAHQVLADVLRRTRGAPPCHLAELAEQMGVGV